MVRMPKREPPPFAALGMLIKEARNKKGLSLQQLADATGISRRQIALMETGANSSLAYLAQVVERLGIRELPLGATRVEITRADASRLREAARSASEAASRAASLLGSFAIDDVGEVVTGRFRSDLPTETDAASSLTGYFVPPGKSLSDLPFEVTDVAAKKIAVPLWGYVAAGEPIQEEAAGETVLVPRALIDDDEVVLKARGESMVEWGIHDGSYVIVKRAHIAATGQLVIAWFNDGITVKQWWYKQGRRRLIAGNVDSPSYDVTDADVCEIRAVVTGIWKPTDDVLGSKRAPVTRRPAKHAVGGKNK